ncbi:heavy metal response regulator transcription factor [Cellvibrio sp. PSBB006]|uniref:heavy metal response regulator transcription factor n=1 Tax=Cellvibrio sp. PSBB006 TaxID=1987723 RepID=UPI000B3B278E|nr:heavy metal response regulator transcription factor [Cellvibrio sp. PSBB006]ARU28089.1 DNA-binding response regulator [Cellvibrio sp. PSBB006]
MALLVIEDDQKTGEYLKKGFQEAGYSVDVARNGIDGLHLALEGEYELIILDVMMPVMDGWTLISALRAKSDVPVIFLTAKDRLDDKLKGLQLGADDYLVKPFSFAELLLRVRTILRRGVARDSRDLDTFQIGDLHFDAVKHKVTRQGVDIVLTKKEFMLLHLLIKRQGEALSRSVIASQVWDMNFDSDTNVVDVAVKRLRAKIDAPFEKKLIHTVRSVGYMFSDQS